MVVETDIEALLITVDEFADRAEDSRNLTWVAKSNSLRRSAMEKRAAWKGIDEQLDNNSTNYQPWISYVTSENLVFNQFVDILFFFFIVLICMTGNVMKLKVEINKYYLSLLRVKGLIVKFGVREKINLNKLGKVLEIVKKGTNPVHMHVHLILALTC